MRGTRWGGARKIHLARMEITEMNEEGVGKSEEGNTRAGRRGGNEEEG